MVGVLQGREKELETLLTFVCSVIHLKFRQQKTQQTKNLLRTKPNILLSVLHYFKRPREKSYKDFVKYA